MSRLSRYQLTADDLEATLEAQDYACAICGGQDERKREDGTPYPLSVDHCHMTGTVRGLLCGSCNSAIGLLKDDPEVIVKAAEYVKLWKRPHLA